ncbi:MAG: DUF835 domain-containing protein [Thermoplasmata archaeon]
MENMESIYYLFGTIYLITTVALVYVAHRGYWADPKGRKNKLFILLCIQTIIWCVGETGYWFSAEKAMVLGFYHFKYVGIIMTGPAFFLIANAVPIWRNILNKHWLIYTIYAIAFVFEFLCLTNPLTNIFFSGYIENPIAPGKYYGILTQVWWVYALGFEYPIILLGIISLLFSIKQARTKIEKAQAKAMIVAVIVPLVGNALNLASTLTPDPTSLAMSFVAIVLGYAISKYRLMSFAPETEKMDGIKEKIPVALEHGYNYLVMDNSSTTYFLLRAMCTQRPGLCVTGKPPPSVRTRFKIEKLPILWVTEVETEEQSANPERLDFEITQSIINFMRENPGSTVFIDDIEYLTIKCGFDAVTNFLKDIADVASATASTFIVQVRPSFLEEEQKKLLASMFDKKIEAPKIELEKVAPRTVLYYRKEDTLEIISHRIPVNERVLVITRTHPKKVAKFFSRGEYYWITDLDIEDVKTIKLEAVDTDFILAIKGAIKSGIKYIVIDGCDVVKIKVSMEKYLSFVKDLTDLAYKHSIFLYCVVEVSDEKENAVIMSRFDEVVR